MVEQTFFDCLTMTEFVPAKLLILMNNYDSFEVWNFCFNSMYDPFHDSCSRLQKYLLKMLYCTYLRTAQMSFMVTGDNFLSGAKQQKELFTHTLTGRKCRLLPRCWMETATSNTCSDGPNVHTIVCLQCAISICGTKDCSLVLSLWPTQPPAAGCLNKALVKEP